MTAWYRALATRPLPPDPATTAEQIAADNVAESATFAPITPAESYSYIPGIVADNGITDNYAVITAYLATLTHGGQNNLVLPPGFIGVGTPVVPPTGVILNGSGYSNSRSQGTVLCPMQTNTIASGHGVVDLSTNFSGVNNLGICGMNAVSYVQTDYALNISGNGNTFTQCGFALGAVASLHTASGAHTTIGTTWFAGTGPSSTALTVWLEAADGQYGDFAAGPTKITGAANQFSNFHLISGPTGVETYPLLYETGGNLFTNGYFDSVLTGANAMIDRSAATKPSRYAACFWFQYATVSVTGIPIFLEATAAGAGADIDGFVNYPFHGTSTFTYFIQNPLASSRVRVNVPTGALTGRMSNNSLGSVINTADGGPAGHVPPLVSQRWYCSNGLDSAAATTELQRVKVTPFWVPQSTTFDAIALDVTTLSATGVVHIGIYADNGAGQPGALVLDAGAVDVTSTGVKTISISQVLTRGWYYIGGLSTTATVGWGAFSGNMPGVPVSNGASAEGAGTAPSRRNCWGMSGVTGPALPGTFTCTGAFSNGPRLQLRVA